MTGPRYSEATKARIVERYVAGEAVAVLARELGCSTRSVRDWVVAAGHEVRDPRAAIMAARARTLRETGEPPPRRTCRQNHAAVPDDEELEPLELAAKTYAKSVSATGATVTLEIVDVGGGELRLIGRFGDKQESWEPGAIDRWPLRVLHLLDRKVTDPTHPRRGGSHAG